MTTDKPSAASRYDIPVEKRPYGILFFIFALILAAGTLWTVADEVVVRRPWKRYQREFNNYESRMVQAKRDSLQAALDSKEEGLPEGERKGTLQQQVDETRRALKQNPDYLRDKSELEKLDEVMFKVNRKYQFTKSIYDEKFYLLTEAKHAGHDVTAIEQTTNRLKSEMDSLLPVIRSMAAQRDSVQRRLDEQERPADSLAGLLQGRSQEITKLTERLEAISQRRAKIQQTVLNDYEPDEFGNPIIRVERCETCHLGINKPEFADAPQPFTTHPKREVYFKDHPPAKFGCTPCHDGQGPALTPESAHRPGEYWDHPMLASDMIEAGCQKCHPNRAWLSNAENLMKAQKKLRRMGCFGCHDIDGYNQLAKVAPPLDRITTKVSTSWIYDWIKHPKNFRADTRMPDFRLPDTEAVSIVAYLQSVSKDKPAENWPTANVKADPGRGRDLVKSIGCLGCHQVDGLIDEAVDRQRALTIDHGPNLSRIGNKVDAAWLFGWLKDPRAYNPSTRMPSLRLTDQEAADITSYLATLKDGAYQPVVEPALDRPSGYLVQQGEYWIRTYGCFGCHTIPGMEKEGKVSVDLSTFGAKDASELFFGDATDVPQTWEAWTKGKLQDSRRYETKQVVQRMPDFAMNNEDAHLFTMLLKSFDGRKVYEAYREQMTERLQRQEAGRLTVEHYNCTDCHEIEGRGGDIRAYVEDRGYHPPILNGEGAKVQSDWLFRFLQQPEPIRPWLKVRMPTFGLSGPEITTISQYFMATNDVDAPFLFLQPQDLDPALVKQGEMSLQKLQCLSCHVLSEEALAKKGAANLAPNLAMAHRRLRPDWIIKWLTDPQKVESGTNMPSFFYSEGQRLYDDADARILSLRDYLMTLEEKPQPGMTKK